MTTLQRLGAGIAAVLGITLASTTTSGAQGSAVRVSTSMACTRGPSIQPFNVMVTMPRTGATGSTFRVRIEGTPTGPISHGGLLYIHDIRTDYLVPPGTRYVADSLHVVADSGTPNVRGGARAWFDGGGIHLELPAHIDNGTSYTPPAIEFDLKIDAAPGTSLPLQFAKYEVTAKVFLLGDLHATCAPNPGPYTTLSELLVAAPIAATP